MKTILKTLFFIGLVALIFSCNKGQQSNKLKQTNQSDFVEGYVVASFQGVEINSTTGQVTGKSTPRGFCILLEGEQHGENTWPMDIYTFNLSDSLFNFPQDILKPNYDGENCGPVFFPTDFQSKYKIKFKYQILDSTDMVQFICGACTDMAIAFPWKNFNQVKLTEVTRIQ